MDIVIFIVAKALGVAGFCWLLPSRTIRAAIPRPRVRLLLVFTNLDGTM